MSEKIKMRDRFNWSLNPKKYAYLAKDKIGKAFLYLLILSMIFGGIQGVTAISTLGVVEKATSEAFKDGKLNFEMKDGNLTFESSPYKQEEAAVLLLVDTDKTIDEVDSLRNITVHKDLSTVILRDGMVVRSGSDETIYKYSDIGLDKFDFNSSMLEGALKQIGIMKYMLFPILIIFKFVDMLFYAFMVSIAGVIATILNKQKLLYKNIFKLSIYSVTLPMLLSLIIPVAKYTMFIGGIMLILGINYTIYSELRNKE